jgi:hypothetical protein
MNPTHTPPNVEATPPEATPAEILRYAAVYLQRHGWHQGDMFATFTGPTPPACAIGAIRMAVCGGLSGYHFEQGQQVNRVVRVLAGYLYGLGLSTAEHPGTAEPPAIVRGSADQVIADWNDEDGRTATEVITTLTEAATDWDRIHGGAR